MSVQVMYWALGPYLTPFSNEKELRLEFEGRRKLGGNTVWRQCEKPTGFSLKEICQHLRAEAIV